MKSTRSSRLHGSSHFIRNLLLVGVFLLLACGPDYNMDEYMSYFQPQAARIQPGDSPFYFSPGFLYDNDLLNYDGTFTDPKSHTLSLAESEMVSDWKPFFGRSAGDSAVYHTVFRKNRQPMLPVTASLSEYLDFAEAVVSSEPPTVASFYAKPKLVPSKDSLLAIAMAHLGTGSCPFLKQRYAFQALRLAQDIHHNDTAEALFSKYFKHKPVNSLDYWALSRAAGASLNKKDSALAIYRFAQVFASCPSHRMSSYLSLRNRAVKFTPSALSYCRTPHEKAAVYSLCALLPWQESLDFMEKIVAVDPSNKLLELIMSREINKSEHYYLPQNAMIGGLRDSSSGGRQSQLKDYLKKLTAFALRTAENDALKKSGFWYTAASYTSYMLDDGKASEYLDKAARVKDTLSGLRSQIDLQRVLYRVNDLKVIDQAAEKDFIGPLEGLALRATPQQNNALFWVCRNLSKKFLQATGTGQAIRKSNGWLCNKTPSTAADPGSVSTNLAKAFLLSRVTTNTLTSLGSKQNYYTTGDLNELEDSTSSKALRATISYLQASNKSDFDKHLIKLSGAQLDDMYLVSGRRSLAEMNYPEAAFSFSKVHDSVWHNEPYKTFLASNPFALDFTEGHGTSPHDTVRYTPAQFTLRMQQLDEAVRKDPAHAFNDLFLLGSGAFNMSWYGNSWLLVANNWSSADLAYRMHPLTATDKLNYYTTSKALDYFTRALKIAPNKEAAARACFMAAKCEQKLFFCKAFQVIAANQKKGKYIYDDPYSKGLKRLRLQEFSKYFTMLSSTYKGSRFELDARGECADYSDFLRHR